MSIKPLPPADFTPISGNYKTLMPFRYWCQKVLPLVYDDSLSYYELLCKVVDYLNKTMEDVETLHGDVTNLRTTYEKLQEYVNNYFSTLDVQEEINNKLDEMARNGKFDELFNKTMNKIWSFTTPIDTPLLFPYASVASNDLYIAAQGLVKYNDYYIVINAYTGNDAASSNKGVNVIVLDSYFNVITSNILTTVGHCNASFVYAGNLYLIGDANDYKMLLSYVPISSLINGSPNVNHYTMPRTYFTACCVNNICYASSGHEVYKFDLNNPEGEHTYVCTLTYVIQQGIFVIGDALYSMYWEQNYNRNRILQFSLLNGKLTHSYLFPSNMGNEFYEIQSMINIGSENDPNLLLYFNSYGMKSKYVLRCQLISSETDVLEDWYTKNLLPYAFENKDHYVYYKPSYNGRITGSKKYPCNTQNILQWFLLADRNSYIETLEDVNSLTIINAKKQLRILGYNITTLNLYYCDIVNIDSNVTNLTAYKVDGIQYTGTPSSNIKIDYVNLLTITRNGCTVTHSKNSNINCLGHFTLLDNINTYFTMSAKNDNLDCLINKCNGTVYKDNAGTLNGTPGENRGICYIKSNINREHKWDMYTVIFIDIFGNMWIKSGYKDPTITTWTETEWKQITN